MSILSFVVVPGACRASIIPCKITAPRLDFSHDPKLERLMVETATII
jgi:hypothetical protein